MPKDITEIILEELRDFRKDMNTRVGSLEETRAEQRGAMGAYSLCSAFVAAVITYVIDYFRHP